MILEGFVLIAAIVDLRLRGIQLLHRLIGSVQPLELRLLVLGLNTLIGAVRGAIVLGQMS